MASLRRLFDMRPGASKRETESVRNRTVERLAVMSEHPRPSTGPLPDVIELAAPRATQGPDRAHLVDAFSSPGLVPVMAETSQAIAIPIEVDPQPAQTEATETTVREGQAVGV
jgi:hypothetical protein